MPSAAKTDELHGFVLCARKFINISIDVLIFFLLSYFYACFLNWASPLFRGSVAPWTGMQCLLGCRRCGSLNPILSRFCLHTHTMEQRSNYRKSEAVLWHKYIVVEMARVGGWLELDDAWRIEPHRTTMPCFSMRIIRAAECAKPYPHAIVKKENG